MRHLFCVFAIGIAVTCGYAAVDLGSTQEHGIVGLTFSSKGDFRVVTGVLPNGPAAKRGIRVGDRVLAIDRRATSTMRWAEFDRQGSGPAGSWVELTIKRAVSGKIETMRLQRVYPDFLKPRKLPPDLNHIVQIMSIGLTPM